MSRESVDLEVEIVSETDRAYLVNSGGREVWLPKSQTEVTEIISMKQKPTSH
jgi:hypothetical protein